MIHNVEESTLRRTVTQTEVGGTAAFSSDLASGISGQTIYVDSGYCIGMDLWRDSLLVSGRPFGMIGLL